MIIQSNCEQGRYNIVSLASGTTADPIQGGTLNLTVNNGLTKSGTAIRLGGDLTGNTNIQTSASTQFITLLASGSMGIGVSPSSRLDVQGTTSDSTANSLILRKADSTQSLTVRNDGSVLIGASSFNSNTRFETRGISTGTSITFRIANSANVGRFSIQDNGKATFVSTQSGVNLVGYSFTPSITATGNTTLTNFQLTPTFTVGSSTSTIYGINYDPTISSSVTPTHYALRATSGRVLIGATSGTYALEVIGNNGANSPFRAANNSGSNILRAESTGTVRIGNTTSVYLAPSDSDGTIGVNHVGLKVQVGNAGIVFTADPSLVNTAQYQFSTNGQTQKILDANNGAGRFLTINPAMSHAGTPQVSSDLYSIFQIAPSGSLSNTAAFIAGIDYNPSFTNTTNLTHYAAIFRSGFVGIQTSTPTAPLDVRGVGTTSTTSIVRFANSTNTTRLDIRDDGSATITGDWSGTTASINSNSTRLATTAFVRNQFADVLGTTGATVSGGILTLNMNSRYQRCFIVSATQSAGFTLALSNASIARFFTLELKITGTVAITMPSDFRMGYDEDGIRWNSTTRILTLVGTTDSPFILSAIYDGAVWKLTASQRFV